MLTFVESHYRVKRSANDRAIVGLSMGGGQSLHTGLSHVDKFSWIGAFSAGAPRGNLTETYSPLAGDNPAANAKLKLLWIACGKDDFLIRLNQDFVKQLDELSIKHTYYESEGSHSWQVWRRHLPMFLTRLFR